MINLSLIVKTLLVPCIFVALALAALFLFQNRLLYFPMRAQLQDYIPDGLEVWPEVSVADNPEISESAANKAGNTADPVLGLIVQVDDNLTTRGTVIVFHGNAGHAGHRVYYAEQLSQLGFRTILAEYPGYGPRAGQPDESTIVNDAVKIVELAHAAYGDPLWLVGESLGAGVVASVTGRTASVVQGVILITPWNRLFDVASYHYPWLPVRWLLRSEYDSITALESFSGPKLIIVAGNDTIVPANLGTDLYQHIPQPKKLITLADAGHNDWAGYVSPTMWSDAMQWLLFPSR